MEAEVVGSMITHLIVIVTIIIIINAVLLVAR